MSKEKINIENYEAFFLDYYEGNLSDEGKAQLRAFLTEHPELKAGFEEFEVLYLEQEEFPAFPKRERLKKIIVPTLNINANNYEEFLISDMEDVLTSSEKAELADFSRQNPFVENEKKVYQKLKLQASATEVFPNKMKLKKGRIIPFYIPVNVQRMAAAIALLLALPFGYLLLRNDNTTTIVQKPETKNIAQTKEDTATLNVKDSAAEQKRVSPVPLNYANVEKSNKQIRPKQQIAPIEKKENTNVAEEMKQQPKENIEPLDVKENVVIIEKEQLAVIDAMPESLDGQAFKASQNISERKFISVPKLGILLSRKDKQGTEDGDVAEKEKSLLAKVFGAKVEMKKAENGERQSFSIVFNDNEVFKRTTAQK